MKLQGQTVLLNLPGESPNAVAAVIERVQAELGAKAVHFTYADEMVAELEAHPGDIGLIIMDPDIEFDLTRAKGKSPFLGFTALAAANTKFPRIPLLLLSSCSDKDLFRVFRAVELEPKVYWQRKLALPFSLDRLLLIIKLM